MPQRRSRVRSALAGAFGGAQDALNALLQNLLLESRQQSFADATTQRQQELAQERFERELAVAGIPQGNLSQIQQFVAQRNAQEQAMEQAKALRGNVTGLLQDENLTLGDVESLGQLGDPAAQMVAPAFQQRQEIAPFRQAERQIAGASTREQVPTTREVFQAAGVGQGRVPGIAKQDPRALRRAAELSVGARQRLPTAREAITPLQSGLSPEHVNIVNQAATTLATGTEAQAARETAQRSQLALEMFEQFQANPQSINPSNVDSAIARAAARFLEPDRLSDADFEQIVGTEFRTIVQSARLGLNRLATGQSDQFLPEERAALVQLITRGRELSQRLLDNTAAQRRRSLEELLELSPGTLDNIVTAPDLTGLGGQPAIQIRRLPGQ